ncbi:MAG: acetylornithine/succinylornithine family transaminase [Acidiferrobacteraceae bacterium]
MADGTDIGYLMGTYSRLPVAFARGEGVWLWDEHETRYLDALAGVAVCGLGHAHPAVRQAICDQAGSLIHTSNWYQIPLQEQLGQALCAVSGMERAFFCNSGAEANEAAIKLARLHGHERKIQNPSIIVMEGSFHGRTLATLSATGNRRVQAGFEPLVSGFNRVPYNDLDSVRQVGEHDNKVVAVLVEPIQGEGGVVIPDAGYLEGLRHLCDERGWLLILDEIQTGMCRTGKWFAWQHEHLAPDIVTVAKALGNGVPIGACLARGAAASLFQAGSHGSTFGGNPLAARAALAVIATLKQQKLDQRATVLGDRIVTGLKEGLQSRAEVRSVRGRGLMIGIDLDRPCKALMEIALGHGLLINVTAEHTVRLLPPLILTNEEADEIVERLIVSVADFLKV